MNVEQLVSYLFFPGIVVGSWILGVLQYRYIKADNPNRVITIPKWFAHLYQFDLIDVHKLTVSAFSLCTRLISNWY